MGGLGCGGCWIGGRILDCGLGRGGWGRTIGGAIDGAIDGTIGGAIDGTIGGAIDGAIDGTIGGESEGGTVSVEIWGGGELVDAVVDDVDVSSGMESGRGLTK